MRSLAMVIVALRPQFLGITESVPAAPLAQPSQSVVCGYDADGSSAELECATTERGPSAQGQFDTTSVPDGLAPLGVLARPNGFAPRSTYHYDDTSRSAQLARCSANRQAGSGRAEPAVVPVFDVAADTGTRLAQDIAVNPVAPRALGLGRSIGRPSHNQALQADIAALPRGATGIRVNQQQVNALGQRVGINRPDLQYTLNGQRYYVEYEGLANPRGSARGVHLGQRPRRQLHSQDRSMTLPSPAGGATTEQVGFFEVGTPDLAEWMVRGFDSAWTARPAGLASLKEAVTFLTPGGDVTRYVCVPVGRWTALISNGPLGTDVGVLPSYAARELGRRAIRVVSVDDTATYPARVLEVYGPGGEPPLALERSIVAANDGGQWVFETSGSAYPFEDQVAYSNRVKARRFTTDMVLAYLRELGVPVDAEPDWEAAQVVERAP